MSKGKRKRRGAIVPRGNSRAEEARAAVDLDVVIPAFGRVDLVKRCLEAVVKACTGLYYSVILVDDKGPEELEYGQIRDFGLGSKVRILRNLKRMGFPYSVNRGVGRQGSELILILNTDVELDEDCVRLMISEFEADPKLGIVGPMLIFHPDSKFGPPGKVQHAGLMVDIAGEIQHANIGWSVDNPKVNEKKFVQAVTGACLMTRRAVWNQIVSFYASSGDPTGGAFNSVYGTGTYEDVEYCFAARGNGWRVVYLPTARATHLVGASSVGAGGFELDRNRLIFRARCGHMLAWDEWRFW